MFNEIITLQFGNYSNYVCSHFWNIQESQFVYSDDKQTPRDQIPDINHDVLFREGLDSQRYITFTPRTILFDLKENINVFRCVDTKRSLKDAVNWSGETQLFKEEQNQTSEFIRCLDEGNQNDLEDQANLDTQVKYWSDYLRPKLHERSYMSFNQANVSNDEKADPFGLFHMGISAAKENDLLDAFENNLRKYSEECDNLQGFHMFVDSFNGFGGLSSLCLDLIREEYNKKSIFSFLTFPDFKDLSKDIQLTRLVNTAFSFKSLLDEYKDIILLPLSLNDSFYMSNESDSKHVNLPLVNYKPELDYQTSAILASLIDSVTVPWRQKSQQNHLTDFINHFDAYNYKMASLQSIYPIEINTDKYLFNYLQENDLCSNATWFTPGINQHIDKNESTSLISGVFSVTCKGIEEERVKNKNDLFVFRDIVPAHEVLERYFTEMYPKSMNTKVGLKVKPPFPKIFKFDSKLPKKAKKNHSVSLLTMLQMNKSIYHLLHHIDKTLRKCNASNQIKYFESGMEHDEFNDLKYFHQNLAESFSK